MADSINQVKIQEAQDHVQEFGMDILETTLLGFDSAKYLSMEGRNKGTRTLTRMEVIGNMGSNWREDYEANPDAFDFIPRDVNTYKADFQFFINPGLLEDSYMGELRKTGQSVDDYPLLSYCMKGSINKKKTETNQSIWTGVRNKAIKGDYTKIYDGFLTILGKELTANNNLLNPVATGLITKTNVLDNVKAMWNSLSDATKQKPLYLHCSGEVALMYLEAWGEKWGTNQNSDFGEALKNIMNVMPAPHAGISGHEMMLSTEDNLVFSYDGVGDDENLNVRERGKGFWYWCDYREGVEFRELDYRFMAINDQIEAVV